MKDKKLKQIFYEFLAGVFLMVPFTIIGNNQTLWGVVSRMLYSFGIMLTMMKLMSILYRMISYVFKNVMRSYLKSYWVLYFLFICLGVVVWKKYSSYFAKGYFVAEIIACVLAAFWFLLDIHTTKCVAVIDLLVMRLNDATGKHTKFVETYKNDMHRISVRQDLLVKELEQYFPKTLLGDSLKDWKREPDLTYIDQYSKRMPFFQGKYKGVGGFLHGQRNINRFEHAVKDYLEKLTDDEQWMDEEKEVYDGCISSMEKRVVTVKKAEQKVEILRELRFDTGQFQKILEGDIADAGNKRKSIKQFWKMHKRINKLRRENYEK